MTSFCLGRRPAGTVPGLSCRGVEVQGGEGGGRGPGGKGIRMGGEERGEEGGAGGGGVAPHLKGELLVVPVHGLRAVDDEGALAAAVGAVLRLHLGVVVLRGQ